MIIITKKLSFIPAQGYKLLGQLQATYSCWEQGEEVE